MKSLESGHKDSMYPFTCGTVVSMSTRQLKLDKRNRDKIKYAFILFKTYICTHYITIINRRKWKINNKLKIFVYVD